MARGIKKQSLARPQLIIPLYYILYTIYTALYTVLSVLFVFSHYSLLLMRMRAPLLLLLFFSSISHCSLLRPSQIHKREKDKTRSLVPFLFSYAPAVLTISDASRVSHSKCTSIIIFIRSGARRRLFVIVTCQKAKRCGGGGSGSGVVVVVVRGRKQRGESHDADRCLAEFSALGWAGKNDDDDDGPFAWNPLGRPRDKKEMGGVGRSSSGHFVVVVAARNKQAASALDITSTTENYITFPKRKQRIKLFLNFN